MNRLLLSGLIAVCSASSASSAVVEVLNDAKGTYTYSVAPTSGADATKTSVSSTGLGPTGPALARWWTTRQCTAFRR